MIQHLYIPQNFVVDTKAEGAIALVIADMEKNMKALKKAAKEKTPLDETTKLAHAIREQCEHLNGICMGSVARQTSSTK